VEPEVPVTMEAVWAALSVSEEVAEETREVRVEAKEERRASACCRVDWGGFGSAIVLMGWDEG